MFALFTSVYQPHINGFTVCINSELSRINEFLFLPATTAASEYPDAGCFDLIHLRSSRSLISQDSLYAFFRQRKTEGKFYVG